MGAFDWNCNQCTFLHKFPAQRCQMCGSLRVSRDEMRGFVQGKRIGDNSHGTSGNLSPTRGSAAMNNTRTDNNLADSTASETNRGDNSVQQPVSSQSGPQHQNQSARPANPYANRPTSSYRPNSSTGSNNNPYASRPTSSYSRPTSSGGVKNPYSRPNSSGGANKASARTIDGQSIGLQNGTVQQNSASNQPTQPIPNPYSANLSRQNAERAGPINPYGARKPIQSANVSGDQQNMHNTTSRDSNLQNQTNRQSSGINQGHKWAKNDRQPSPGITNQNQHFRAQNGMSQSQFNRQSVQGGFGEQGTVYHDINQNQPNRQPTHGQIAVNQDMLNRQDQNRQNASVQGIRDKPIAPLFLPNQGNVNTASRSKGQDTAAGKSNSQQHSDTKNRWNRGLPYEKGPVPLSESTSHNWIFPIDDKYPERSYQLEMAHTSIMTNTLVSLPTGLGKTLVAAVVMYNYYRWFPTGKVIFCAPTRPLVTQQIQACYNIMGIPERHTAEISAKNQPEVRQRIWDTKRVFFCTPQALVNDIKGDRINAKDIVCVVIDEAHKATGNHANAQLFSLIKDAGAKFRLVALSATPGTDIKSIQQVITTLNICQIEAKTENDPDVLQYIHKRQEDVIIVDQPDAVSRIDSKFSDLMSGPIEHLHSNNVGRGTIRNHRSLKPFTLKREKDNFMMRNPNDYSLHVTFTMLFEMASLRNLLFTHGVRDVWYRLQTLQHNPKNLGAMVKGDKFQSLLREVSKAIHPTQDSQDDQEATEDLLKNNPKYEKLYELLVEHFTKKKADNQDTRVIIFSQWRLSVESIVLMINSQNDETLKPSAFIGQSKKQSGGKQSNSREAGIGTEQAGMKQAEQQRVLDDFKVGIYNILVCTSVAEEGLDIGDVDLIIMFDVIKSPIRSIQRSGRTGRKRDGRVVFLVSKGKEEKDFNESVLNKKKIERALQSNKNTFQFCVASPMFPADPTLHRQKMSKTNFRMSQVGGHTPKGSRKNSKLATNHHADWVLTSAQERERHQFGNLPELNSRGIDNSRFFPQSLRRDYLRYRERTVATQRYRRDGSSYRNVSTIGSCLKNFERRYLCINKSLPLTPLDEALSKLQNTQDSVAERMVLDDDYVSMNASEPSMASVRCPTVEEEDLTEIPSVETTSDADPLDAIFGSSETCDPAGTPSSSQISFLFDSEEHINCSVSPPPGLRMLVSTDNDSDDSESVSAQSKSSQLSANTMDVDFLCDFFDNPRPLSARKLAGTSGDEPTESLDQVHSEPTGLFEDAAGNERTMDETGVFEDNSIPLSARKLDGICGDEPTESFDQGHAEPTDLFEDAAGDEPTMDETRVFEDNPRPLSAKKLSRAIGDEPTQSFDQVHAEQSDIFEDAAGNEPTMDEAGVFEEKVEPITAHPSVELEITLDANNRELSQEKRLDLSLCKPSAGAIDNLKTDSIDESLPSCLVAKHELSSIIGQDHCSDGGERECIVALQLPTPPDSSDDESMADNESQVCINETYVMLDTSKIEGIQHRRQDQLEQESFTSHIEETQEDYIEPLQLPTQCSSSEDEENDDDEVVSLECRDHKHSYTFDVSNAVAGDYSQFESEMDKDLREPHEQSSLNLESDALDNPPDEDFEIDEVKNVEQIVPLYLPTQYSSSSSSDEEENEEESDDEQHNAKTAAASAAADTDFIDLCDDNEDDNSAKKMPPPSLKLASLKNITNIADQQHFSPCDDLVDTPVPTNVKLKSSISSMSSDDLTDTPISERPKHVATSRLSEGLSDTPIKTAQKEKAPKRLARARKRLRAAANDKENQKVADDNAADRQERVKQRIEGKYRCRFLDTEAALDGSGEDSDEEDIIKQIEEDESNSSFINDSSQLGYTQDDLDDLDADKRIREGSIDPEDSLLHRQFNHERNVAEQFKTPVFNRRMMRDSLSQNAPMSQQGLGSMNFIKSVLEHHRQGGDSDDIENEYRRLVGDAALNESQVNSPLSIADSPEMSFPQVQAAPQPNFGSINPNQPIAQSTYDSNRKPSSSPAAASLPPSTNQPTSLTAEQKAMIEAKRAAALKRRQERMQQQPQTSVSNPYAK